MENEYKQIVNLIEDLEVNKRVREYKDNSDTLNTYWNIGKLIYDASKNLKTKYGSNLIKNWSLKLEKEYGRNYCRRNLELYQQFYIIFQNANALRSQLTWTHYKAILPIKDENARNYYINQVILNNLSTRELIKEIKSKAFERLSYADKENIKLIEGNNYKLSIKDMLKDPIYLKVNKNIDKLNEKAIHKLIIELLEDKFLELGTGFTLAGHEYKIIIGDRTYKIDLLFFNIELNSYVVVEVKTKENKSKDIGQLEMYVEYINKHVKKVYHEKTIGILLVEKENKLIIEYITNEDVFITRYELI